jgi:hypothetical protein
MNDMQPLQTEEITQKRIDRFWSKITKTESCWIWNASKTRKGYGNVGFGTKVYRVHRIAYYLSKSVDPFPQEVLHTCDNPCCVNPEHLFLGNNLDNIRDKQAKGRQTWSVGSGTGSAILDEALVAQIKQYLVEGYRQSDIAKHFSVSRSTIHLIHKGSTWKHVII